MNSNFSNYNVIFKLLLPFGYILGFSYILGFILFLYLPKEGIEFSKIDSYNISSKRYNFTKAFDLKDKVNIKVVKKVEKKEYKLLSNIELNAVYLSKKNKSWIVLNEKSSSKTFILSKSDKFKDFELIKIFKEYIVFKKKNIEYKLQMESKKLDYEVLTKKENKKQKEIKSVNINPIDIKLSNTTKLGVR